MPPLNKPDPFQLIVHIGAGKTGTTSIQETLRFQQDKLMQQGVWYLGLMLENAPEIRYHWQRDSGFEEFMKLSENERINQLVDILNGSLRTICDSKFKSAILSNEAFFSENAGIIKALKVLVDKGWDIKIIVYVRRHDAWLKSAYEQWGLKHKTYEGRLLPFSAWVSPKGPLGSYYFGGHLRSWTREFKCIIRNVSAIDDAVSDFLTMAEISKDGIVILRENTSLSSEELLLRALFNNQFQGLITPDVFDNMMGVTSSDFGQSVTHFLSSYLPTDTELKKCIGECLTDREEINRLLEAAGQPILDTAPLQSVGREIDLGKLIMPLFTMLVRQAIKIADLESKIGGAVFASDKPIQQTAMALANKKEDILFHIDAYQNGFMHGWIVNKTNPFRLAIELHTTQGKIGQGVADQFRKDLIGVVSEDGCCAFKIWVDPSIKNFGDQIIIKVKNYNECFYVSASSIIGLPKNENENSAK